MKNTEYTEFLRSRNVNDDAINCALNNIADFEVYLAHTGKDIDSVSVPSVKKYFSTLIAGGENSTERLRDLARYFYATGQNEIYIYIISTVSGREVLESISDKLASKKDTECRESVFEGLEVPRLAHLLIHILEIRACL